MPVQRQILFFKYSRLIAWKAEANYINYVSRAGKPGLREYPSVIATPGLMHQWLDACNRAFQSQLSMEQASESYARLHLEFVAIHPFFDGAGRMARLVANLPVLKSGYPPIIVPKEDRQRYRETISHFQESIPNLSGLTDLNTLPSSAAFHTLCAGYWLETLRLVDEARALQARVA